MRLRQREVGKTRPRGQKVCCALCIPAVRAQIGALVPAARTNVPEFTTGRSPAEMTVFLEWKSEKHFSLWGL